MFGDPGGAAVGQLGCNRSGGSDIGVRNSGIHAIEQRAGIRGGGAAEWLQEVGAKTLYLEPRSPWENGYCESFNGRLRDECLNVDLCRHGGRYCCRGITIRKRYHR